jgi:hydrogenase maturation factor
MIQERESCTPGAVECSVCGDVATRATILELFPETGTATARMGSSCVTIATDLVSVAPGDDVLVHLGFAIQRLERA